MLPSWSKARRSDRSWSASGAGIRLYRPRGSIRAEPSASSLTDSKGYAIKPFDLSSGTSLKCGNSDQGILRDLITGLDGTPMPSFSSALKPDQMWDVVHYLATLREAAKHHGAVAANTPKAE